MRTLLVLTLTTAALASPAAAQGAMDRYGYSRVSQSTGGQLPQASPGRVLNWANKASPEPSSLQANTAQDYGDSAEPQRTATYPGYQVQAPYRPVPQRLAVLSTPPRYIQPQSAPPAAQTPPTERQPEPVVVGPQRLALAGGPPQSSPPPLAPPVAPSAPAGSGQARYYSLHREYGLTPDAIPEQPLGNRFVLIGPSSNAGQDPAPDKDDESGAGDKPF